MTHRSASLVSPTQLQRKLQIQIHPVKSTEPVWMACHEETVEGAICSMVISVIAEQPALPHAFMAHKLLEHAVPQAGDDE